MKRFLPKVLLFSIIPVICWLVIEASLPINFFTYRIWEAISFKTNIPGFSPFYPNKKISMVAVGDLCHHTPNSIQKNELWITDELGYRNDEFISDPDILIIGDSFIAGTSLTQENTLTNRIMKNNSHVKVYNMAPGSFTNLDYYLNTGRIKKPKLIIFAPVERNVPSTIKLFKANDIDNSFKKLFTIGSINEYLDRAFKNSSIKWLNARFHNTKGFGKASIQGSKMFFFEGSDQKHSSQDLYSTVNNLISYKKYCDSLGIYFLFVPMPDKESVYYDLVPMSKQPSYLFELDSLLIEANISTLNTLEIYNDYRTTSNNLLYQLDDTHWNQNATRLISNEICNVINSKAIFGIGTMSISKVD